MIENSSVHFSQNTRQGLRQDLQTGYLKLAIVKLLGILSFKGNHNILRKHVFTNINIYLCMEIRHTILIQYRENYVGGK